MDSIGTAPTHGNEPKREMPRAGAAMRILLSVAAAGLIVLTIVRTAIWWKTGAGISFASGVMITMAADLTKATFYRPLFGPAGYGGTRYFPLYFSLQALLMKLGMPVLASAYLLSAGAIVLLLWGTSRLLRELGAERWLAACAAVVLLASSSVQMALTTPQADGLAAALNIWGLAMIARSAHNRRSTFPSALLFTLAWSAKVTTVFGLVAAFVWLALANHKRMAWRLALQTGCGYAMVAAVMMLASRGRVLEIFRACASGGTNLQFLIAGPVRMESMALYTDPILLPVTALALLGLFSWNRLRSLPGLLLIATLAVTIFIFGTPGTAQNHLLDLQVAAVVLLARAALLRKQLGMGVLALLTLAGGFMLARHMRTWSRWYHPHQFQQVIAAAAGRGPILAENPIIPVLAGQQPYVLDPWMVQLLRTHFPGFQQPLLERLRRQEFGAVVLTTGAISENGAQEWFDNNSFGPGFVEALQQHYTLSQVIARDYIYLPKPSNRLAKSPSQQVDNAGCRATPRVVPELPLRNIQNRSAKQNALIASPAV